MADYSMSPLDLLVASRKKDYVGLHVEQGVPVLDRDLNLLHDLIAATVREIVTSYIGNGSPAGVDGFRIEALGNPADAQQNFRIAAGTDGPGRCLVGGLEVTVPVGGRTYKAQTDPSTPAGLPALTTPTAGQPDPRPDVVYVDAFLVEVDATRDPDLRNDADVGVQTSVRLQPAWVVRVAENSAAPPAAPAGHAFHVLATLARRRGNPAVTAEMITDRRQRELTVSAVERRLNRVEAALLPTFVAPRFFPRANPAGTQVTITGTNFDIGAVVVRFDEVVASGVTVVSPTRISATVPRGLAVDGVEADVVISVENAVGRVAVEGLLFGVLPTPAFAASGAQFEPPAGVAGDPITLHGDNLNLEGLTVQFGTRPATVVGTPTARRIDARVPTGLVPAGQTNALVKISLTHEGVTATSDDDFRVTTP
jgi:hypothetical protein